MRSYFLKKMMVPAADLDTIQGNQHVKDWAFDNIGDAIARPWMYTERNMPDRSLLMPGPPGTGKTSLVCTRTGTRITTTLIEFSQRPSAKNMG